MTQTPLENLQIQLNHSGLDALALNPGPTLSYLTGLNFHLMERPVVLIITRANQPVLVLPELEKIKTEGKGLTCFTYGDNPDSWQSVFNEAAASLSLVGKKIGVEPTRLRFLELSYLRAAIKDADFITAGELLGSLRIIKSSREIELMRRAVKIAEEGFQSLLKQVRQGMTEKEAAGELCLNLLKAGSDSEFPFTPIIASGPNSANPHAVPSERKFTNGDLVIIDWGASFDGYFSDLTRTLAIGQIEPEFQKIASLVRQANKVGRNTARPGIAAGAVDLAARAVIEQGGYGPFFNHRLGHGLGMEAHEQPYIFSENSMILTEGMSFTIEPGIYLPDRGGVRIEDNVIISSSGCDCLSSLSRELYQIP